MKHFRIPAYMFYGIVILIVALFLISYFGIKDANSCLSNPFVYGANKGSTSDSGDMFCTCIFDNNRYAPLYFDKENITVRLSDFITQNSSELLGVVLNES